MKSLLREMKEKFHEIENDYCDSCDRPADKCVCDDETVEEQNVTGAIAGFSTPKAFAKKTNDKTAEQLGYKKVQEAMDKKYLELIEGYRDFKKGDVKPSHTVKNTIKEIAKKLQEIETLVHYNSRLKNEAGIASSEYGTAASKALAKISERLVKISERVRSLGE
jgi:enoyl-[acyl-carrier-protein] reductase (NADH)